MEPMLRTALALASLGAAVATFSCSNSKLGELVAGVNLEGASRLLDKLRRGVPMASRLLQPLIVLLASGAALIVGGCSASADGVGRGTITTDGGVPFKEGVPIGDCEELSAAALAMRGCPPKTPMHESSCGASGDPVCPYEITVSEGRAEHAVYRCLPLVQEGPRVWFGSRYVCGESCSSPDPANTIQFEGSACADRPLATCAEGALFAPGVPAQDYLVEELSKHVYACFGSAAVNTLLELEVRAGCPVRLSGPAPFDAAVAACLEGRLEGLRWDCAQKLACVHYLWSQ